MSVAKKLRTLRVVHGYEQEDVATKAKIQSQQSYGRIENNLREPSADELRRIAEIYNLTTDQIYAWDFSKTTSFLISNLDIDRTSAETILQLRGQIHEQQKKIDAMYQTNEVTIDSYKSQKSMADYWRVEYDKLKSKYEPDRDNKQGTKWHDSDLY